MDIKNLKPEIVWKFFHEITQVPRPSKKEGKIIQYLESFAKEYNIPIKKDKVGNILMTKAATPGYEKLPTVILQSHMDMVCEKNSDKVFDFENDPIQTVVDGKWLRADGTTLGADNGIGMAAELAILASNDIEHGTIECLFTVDEETGLTGAKALESGFMTGEILLNLDSEDEGELFIGCAGGKDTQAVFYYEELAAPEDMLYFRIDVKGLKGGHSGGEIHKGLGNANKILVRFLYLLKKNFDFVLSAIDGGNLRNAIAREAYAVIGLKSADKEEVRVMLNRFTADIENELKHVDPDVQIVMQSVDRPEKYIDPLVAEKLIYSLYACPHGVIAMSHDIEGLVETSTNLASVKMKGGDTIVIGTSQRSSIESAKESIANQVACTFLLAGATVTHGDGYPGWAPNPNSKVLKVAEETYKGLFNKEPKIMAIHAGLECGLFLEKYPYLDMISFGPTLRDVHSPDERIEIDTVGLWWQHTLELLKNIPAK
ncbi:dipeptidase D [Parabacteroides sp. PF5-5]|uniref:aminoacyl-histidine dipeptidase n=1 Tax=unclassified Parabacteroides TaxID=2649774 RepID=UPI0024767C43|nr:MULTISPECIES: aminoacyl-histidine dipeptidase [unclassified Parabacteroides]MDH6305104.1 dipeptidase D [Parabacteroides sp. PH5-39]MDH6316454.1 dipeptidase D [Parabacteroides sp. PF5-13]MDH6319964.1 dipeptidase D [Parabacteroides sp. PH5-13]MDH6323803.1 dipeptidase D [Parabacteroides sp. PH5-8]MDH6327641.1 dipeptidase D [Parabacteroides sp. PH5-41]